MRVVAEQGFKLKLKKSKPVRNYLLFLFLAFLAGPALSQTVIDDLHISRDGEVVNIRVSLKNPGSQNQQGPIQIELFGRPIGGSDWKPIYAWNDIGWLAKGHRVTRDFFSTEGDVASELALGEFEVRAVLSGPNLSEVAEKEAEHEHDHDHH